MGGDEGTILRHKIKAREKSHLTNKKPTIDTTSQCRIPIKKRNQKSKENKPLKKTKLQMH